MEKTAVFPGSFDPITRGHESLVKRALPLFDKLYIALGTNTEKSCYFSLDQRLDWVRKVFSDYPSVVVKDFKGLTVDFCKSVGASYILRGLRTSADFEFERSIGQINKKLNPSIETVFLLTASDLTPLNSSIIRDILKHGGDPSQFVPDRVDLSPYLQKS